MRRLVVLLVVAALAAGGYWYYQRLRPSVLVLTGIVTTNDVIVSSQIAGQIDQLLVAEGASVKKGQLGAVIKPDELKADTAYYTHNVEGLSSQVRESEAALRYQERQTVDQIRQAESTLASTEAQVAAATADFENARLLFTRTQDLAKNGIVAPQELDQTRTSLAAAQAKVDALKAGRGAARYRGAGAIDREADRNAAQPGADQRAHAGGRDRAAAEGRRAPGLHRDPRAHRRHCRRARRARRRGRLAGPADRDADQSR
jgi:HlyD family secretion protein